MLCYGVDIDVWGGCDEKGIERREGDWDKSAVM